MIPLPPSTRIFLACGATDIRSLVEEIILLLEEGELKIDVRGDLAGILSIAVERKKPAGKAGLKRLASSGDVSHLLMVAGAGFEPATFRL